MNYNDGNIYDNFYDEPIEKLQARARDYSEGNKDLEATLLNLWKQGVPTTSCCIGHEKKEDNDESGIGFFIFKLENPKSTEFLNLIYIMFEEIKVEGIYLDISSNYISVNFPREYGNLIFKMLNKLSEKDLSLENEELEINPILEIIELAKKNNMFYSCTIEQGKIQITIYDDTKHNYSEIPRIALEECNELKLPIILECTYQNIDKLTELVTKYNNKPPEELPKKEEENKEIKLNISNFQEQNITISSGINYESEEDFFGKGYITFEINNPNSFHLLNLIYKQIEELKKYDVTMTIDEETVSIYFPGIYTYIIYELVNKLSKEIKTDYQDKMEIEPILAIIDFAKEQDRSLEYTIKNEKILVAIYDEEEIEEKDPDEILKSIDEYSEITFPFIAECTKENIDKLNHMINNYNSNESHNYKNGIK